jgi:flagellar motility protein MotE (MotC chaperone)
MIRWVRDFRLVPIVLFATISLFALKAIGLLIDGRYLLDGASGRNTEDMDTTGTIAPVPASAPASKGKPPGKQSWAQQMFNFPDVTGAAGEGKTEQKEPAPASGTRTAGKPEEPKGPSGWSKVPLEGSRPQSPAEIAILERLQERRAELDARMKDIEMRESLLKAAEKRLEGRIAELKELEARFNNSVQQRDDGEAARFKNVVTMYENMKAKDAAKIFDRLEIKILVEVATQINPRRMSDILAQMSPEAAERLTVELAARSAAKDKAPDLPKIEGKPTN